MSGSSVLSTLEMLISPYALGFGAVSGLVFRKRGAAIWTGLIVWVVWMALVGMVGFFIYGLSLADGSRDGFGTRLVGNFGVPVVLLIALFGLQATLAALGAQWLVVKLSARKESGGRS